MAKLFEFAVGFLERVEQFLNHPLQQKRIIGKGCIGNGGCVLHTFTTSGAREKLRESPKNRPRKSDFWGIVSLVAGPPFGGVQIDAREDQGQVGGGDRQTRRITVGLRKWKLIFSFFQSFHPDHVSILVPVEQFDAILSFGAKDEE